MICASHSLPLSRTPQSVVVAYPYLSEDEYCDVHESMVHGSPCPWYSVTGIKPVYTQVVAMDTLVQSELK